MLTGTGKAFSAGVDTKAAATLDRDGQRAGVEAINSLVTTLFGLPLPVVAAVNGHALGGGLIVPLACDVLVATRADCKLGLTEVVAGVPVPGRATGGVPAPAVAARLQQPVPHRPRDRARGGACPRSRRRACRAASGWSSARRRWLPSWRATRPTRG